MEATRRPGNSYARLGRAPTIRGAPGGGGVMSMIARPRVRESGRSPSTVYGEFAPEFRKQIPGAEEDPRFWASGISLIAHPRNRTCRLCTMNTRMVVTSKWWFGGGGRSHARARQAAHAGGRRHAVLPCRDVRRLRAARGRRLSALQANGARNTSICRIARRCAASAASSTIT